MVAKKTAKRHRNRPTGSLGRGSRTRRRLVVSAIAVVAVGAAVWWWMGVRNHTTPAGRTTGRDSSGALASSGSAQRLVGRWQRTDAGYVIEISGVAKDGTVDAAYLNPDPIHVSRALASDAGGALDLFVELMDIGYPGATYTLRYSPEYDALVGIYHQPTAGQDFEVAFERK